MKINTEKVKKIREELKLTQEDVSEKLNMHQTAYSRFEKGETKVDLDKLLNLSKILGCEPLDLISYDNKTVNINHSENSTISGFVENQYVTVDRETIDKLQKAINLLFEKLNKS
jgi:transcriptional regulator with XRE-family HTH domain